MFNPRHPDAAPTRMAGKNPLVPRYAFDTLRAKQSDPVTYGWLHVA